MLTADTPNARIQVENKAVDRQTYLDSARGMAMLMVVWMHIAGKSRLPEPFMHILYEISTISVALFFLLAGYLFSHSLNKSQNEWRKIFWRKFKSILVPFYALSICFIPFGYINQHLLQQASKTWFDSLKALVVLDINERLPSGVLWFLFVLFMFFMVTLLITTLVKNKTLSALFLWIIAIASLAAAPWVSEVTFFGLNRFCLMFFYFIFGFYILGHILRRASTPHILALCTALYGIAFICYVYYFERGTYLFYAFDRIAMLTGALSTILAFKLFHEKRKRKNGIFYFCGVHSMSIFVFHMPFSAIIMTTFKKTGFIAYPVSDAVWLVLSALLPLGLEFLLCFTPKLHRVFLGRAPIFKVPSLLLQKNK